MRIKIEGKCDEERFLKIFNSLKKHFGDFYMSGLNIYFTPKDNSGKTLSLIDGENEELGTFIFRDKEKVKRKLKPLSVVSINGNLKS